MFPSAKMFLFGIENYYKDSQKRDEIMKNQSIWSCFIFYSPDNYFQCKIKILYLSTS